LSFYLMSVTSSTSKLMQMCLPKRLKTVKGLSFV
jgi:hypothetical protein